MNDLWTASTKRVGSGSVAGANSDQIPILGHGPIQPIDVLLKRRPLNEQFTMVGNHAQIDAGLYMLARTDIQPMHMQQMLAAAGFCFVVMTGRCHRHVL